MTQMEKVRRLNLTERRQKAGLTVREAAWCLEVREFELSIWERFPERAPLKRLAEMAQVYGLKGSELLTLVNELKDRG